MPNADGRLKPGFFATAQIEEAQQRPGILVPAAAVRTIAGTARVFVIDGDRAEERIVMTGQAVGDQIEIASGVKAGERVATSGVDQLVDGVRVVGEVTVMQWLAALCVQRPVFAWVLVLSLTVVGLFAFGQLGVDRFPNVDIPTISVTTRLPGAAPEQIETEVTDKIEESVNTISGIDTLSSTSSEGISQVVVSFKLEKNADIAAQEVRDRVNRVMPQLPRTVLQPTVEKLDFTAAPVITVAVTADKPVRDITEFADRVLRRRLESSDGVGQVVVIGGRKRQVNLWLDPALLRAQRLSVNDVARALQSQNADVPGGRMDQGAQSVTLRTRGRIETDRRFRRRGAARGRRPPDPAARRRARRRRHGRAAHAGQRQRRRHGAAADPQAVGHQHRRSRQQRQAAPRRARRPSSRPAISCASSATRRSSSRRRSPACRNTWSSARSSPPSSSSCSSATCARR